MNYPWWFIQGETTDATVERRLIAATTPMETMQVTSNLGRGNLGSAMDFYLRRDAEVIAGGGGSATMQLPDWNLDADRGYGFKCWQMTVAPLPSPLPSDPTTSPLQPPDPLDSHWTTAIQYV